ncbi:MAG: hypothetical protein Fur0035_12100 [Anaerolineales bacterium]
MLHPWIKDIRFAARPGETGVTQNIYCGLQEFQEMAYVLHVTRQEDLFVDVGANAGSYTLLACGVCGARGYAFEPVPTTYERLVQNIHLNHLNERVKTLNIGISDEDEEISFTAGLDTTNHALTQHETAKTFTKVKVLPLDAVLKNESPSIIKIDVEGMETLVMRGMKQTLELPGLHSIIVELNGSGQRYGFDEMEVIGTLRASAFNPYRYDPLQKTLTPIENKNPLSGNTLFLRKLDFIQRRLANSPRLSLGFAEI